MSRLFLTCCLIIFFVTPVMAFDDYVYPYTSITLGTALTSVSKLSDSSGSLKTDFKPGYMAGLSAGVTFNLKLGANIEKIRTEAEIAYRSNKLDKIKNAQGQTVNSSGSVSVINYMINCYLENTSMLSNNVPITIFLTAGAGAATASIIANSTRNTQLAYQGGLGAGYEFTKNITLDVAYKYMGTTTFQFAGVKAEYGSHNILLGARYSFK